MLEEKTSPLDKAASQYIKSIQQEIAGHAAIIAEAIRKKDATLLIKTCRPLMKLNREIRKKLSTGALADSAAIQKILAISRQQIRDLQMLSCLQPEDIIRELASPKWLTDPLTSYSEAIPDDAHFKILEHSNLNSVVALSRTNTQMWDMLNSKEAAPIWKELANIYFSRRPEKDTIDSMQKFKKAFVKNYSWNYTLPDDSISPFSYHKIKRKGLLFRKTLEGSLISSLESKEFKADFKKRYTEPFVFYAKGFKAESDAQLRSAYLALREEQPFVWHDFLDTWGWGHRMELNKDKPVGILYEVQGLYEQTHNEKYKAELDYIFNLAIAESGINLEEIITQFADGLVEPNEQLRGTEQERAQFFYVIYLAMRCYQTSIIDQLLAKGFRVDDAIVYGVKKYWKIIDPEGFRQPGTNLNSMNMLDMAMETQSFKMINYLVGKGVDIDVTAELAYSSVNLEVTKLSHFGESQRKNLARLQFLLEHHADPNKAGNDTGITPLHSAAGREVHGSQITNQCKIVQLLLAHGADVNMRTQSGATPLYFVKHYAVAELLVANNGDVNAESHEGFTPLYGAICTAIARSEKGKDPQKAINIARLLCQHNADINKRINGKTLLETVTASIPKMPDRKAKQQLKELLTVLQTTKPILKQSLPDVAHVSATAAVPTSSDLKRTTPRSAARSSVASDSSSGWMSLFSWKTVPDTEKSEKKDKKMDKNRDAQSLNHLFPGGFP